MSFFVIMEVRREMRTCMEENGEVWEAMEGSR